MTGRSRRLALSGAAIVLTLCAGTLGYVFIAGYPWLDAVYMAIMTTTTVGYAEIHPLDTTGRLFNSLYIVLSVSTMFLVIGVMTQAIVEAQFRDILGERRIKKMIDKLKNHYIICGFGRVGRSAAAELKNSGAPFVIIDRNQERVDWARRLGYLAYLGDSTRDEVLRGVHIGRAAGLIAALSTDADNLFAVISAKTLQPGIRVAARAAEEEAERKMLRAGADSVFAPYRSAGSQLAQSLLKPHVRRFLDFATSSPELDVRIEQVRVASSSGLAGKSLAETRIRGEMRVVVLAIRRATGDMEFNPPASALIQPQDYLIVMGEPDSLRRFEAYATGGEETS